jgi:hypothetical protein
MERVAREVQELYEEENPQVGIVAQYLERKLPVDWPNMDLYARRQWLESSAEGTEERRTVCSLEVWAEALGQNPDKLDRYAGKDVRDIMARLPEWKHQGNARITTGPYGRQRYFKRRVEA